MTTGAMQELGGRGPSNTVDDFRQAGLVLLYAEKFEQLPAAWPLYAPRLTIGRDATADLVLDVPAVSRRHAELRHEKGLFYLTDLGSRNGTFVDGQRIVEVVLEPAHELRIGDSLLKFVERDVGRYGDYRIDGSLVGAAHRLAPRSRLIGGYELDHIAADFERIAPTNLNVMVLGESGTGKEVVARELHERSGRAGPFLAVNCAAIPQNLIESELFGYKKGAFSGADRDKPGILRGAHGGTLLLDEIGDMPLEAQAKLLRVLQSREISPIGATQPELVDVRFISATHRDLVAMQATGKFRQDLYARLNEYQVKLPPLRAHKEDLYQLVKTFLAQNQRSDLRPSFGFMTGLVHYDWPYNVRELEACIKRASALCRDNPLEEEYLTDPIREAMADYGRPWSPLAAGGERPEGRVLPSESELRELLTRHQGNVAAVGRVLGKARMQIHRWVARYGIDLDDFR